MKKVPFSIGKFLDNPEQEIETAFGEPAIVVFTEGLGPRPILAVIYDGDTTDSAWYSRDGKDFKGNQGLFIIKE